METGAQEIQAQSSAVDEAAPLVDHARSFARVLNQAERAFRPAWQRMSVELQDLGRRTVELAASMDRYDRDPSAAPIALVHEQHAILTSTEETLPDFEDLAQMRHLLCRLRTHNAAILERHGPKP